MSILDNITNTIFSGPSYDEYSQARSDLYTNSPSKYSYDVNVNKAAADFATGRTKEVLGDNPFTTGLTTAGTIAGIPLAIGASPFHEAIQAKERMEPGSGILGWGKAFLDEDPFSTAFNRGVGVASSGQVGQFGNWLGESIYDLTHGIDDDETGTIAFDPSDPRFTRSGIGIISGLNKMFGPKIAAYLKNKAIIKVVKKLWDPKLNPQLKHQRQAVGIQE